MSEQEKKDKVKILTLFHMKNKETVDCQHYVKLEEVDSFMSQFCQAFASAKGYFVVNDQRTERVTKMINIEEVEHLEVREVLDIIIFKKQ